MPYQLNASTLFLTYPQYPLSKEVTLDALTQLLQADGIEILEYVVASEEHATGDLHVHCYLKLSSAVRTRSPLYFDIRGHHGNYQGARSARTYSNIALRLIILSAILTWLLFFTAKAIARGLLRRL